MSEARCIAVVLVMAASCFFGVAAAGDDATRWSCDVFVGGQDGYHTYRIPVMAVTKAGTLLAFCEGRKTSASDRGDIDLLLNRSQDGGRNWSPSALVHEEGGEAEITIGNPCPVVDQRDGSVWLAFTRNNERAFVMRSADDGVSWSAPAEITEALKQFAFQWTRVGTGPVNGIQMQSGRLVLPVWLNDKIGATYRSACVVSDDHGATWRAGGLVPDSVPNCNECTVAETEPGVLCMNLRSKNEAKRRAVAWSRDGGMTWTDPVYDHALIDPVCQGSMLQVTYEGKPCLLFANASSTKRERLTVRASIDGGKTWTEGVVLRAGPSGYSCLADLSEGGVACLYEAGEETYREKIVFETLAMREVVEGDGPAALVEPGVALTFDDTHVAEWVAAIPLFEQYGAHATFFVSNFDKLTEEQIAGLHRLKDAEHAIGCHGLRHRKAAEYARESSAEQYVADEVTPAVNLMVNAGLRPTAFAYPSSNNDAATDQALLRVFRHLRSGASLAEGQRLADCDALFTPVAAVSGRGCLNGRSIDSAGESGAGDKLVQIREAFARAKERGEAVVLYAHKIGTEPGHHITLQGLEQVLKDARELGLKFYTFDELP
ncbi:MAG: exo-alpha-sialidase [Candidatus Hydrogenedentales bacterium]|jgi:sialidase-1